MRLPVAGSLYVCDGTVCECVPPDAGTEPPYDGGTDAGLDVIVDATVPADAREEAGDANVEADAAHTPDAETVVDAGPCGPGEDLYNLELFAPLECSTISDCTRPCEANWTYGCTLGYCRYVMF